MNKETNLDTIVFGAGCFWCVEAVFQQLNGVIQVTPGYCGGFSKNPTYKEVCNGTTGHAEVAKIVFDSSLISLPKLVEVFFMTHDPTTLNRHHHHATANKYYLDFWPLRRGSVSARLLHQQGMSIVRRTPWIKQIHPPAITRLKPIAVDRTA